MLSALFVENIRTDITLERCDLCNEAVVAKKGPLSGRTAGEVGFRTRYGAAVIAVHRDGTRVQDHPGNVYNILLQL